MLPNALKKLIESFESLPGIGPRTAARLAYFMLRAPENLSVNLAKNLVDLKKNIKVCTNCYNYAEDELCQICASEERHKELIMVVEEPLDVVAFERVGSYKGVFHVLGGVISPMNGIGPDEIRIKELIGRLNPSVSEIIIATNPNLEGESTALYIKKEIEKRSIENLKITRLARGLPTGADLEYADETTLERAFAGRTDF